MNILSNMDSVLFYAFMLLIVVGFVMALMFFADPYSIQSSMVKLEKQCEKRQTVIDSLTTILDKMKSCPRITDTVTPFEVDNIDGLKLFIVGGKDGKPRLFAYAFNSSLTFNEYNNLIKSSSFKRVGKLYSIDADKLGAIIDKASRVNFKKQLDDKQEREIIEHFK